MGDMPWGAHICLFYETKEDLLDANAAYIKAGLDSNKYRAWPISEPISEDEAWAVSRRDIPDLDNRATSGQFEVLPGYDWYLKGDEFNSKKITSGWHEKLQFALDKGFEGLRISGNAFWIERNRWNEFREHEQELDESLEDRPMLVLCIRSVRAARSMYSTLRRPISSLSPDGEVSGNFWRRQNSNKPNGRSRVLAKPCACCRGRSQVTSLLTSRERIVLAQIVRGASSKEAAAWLNVSPRTIEFHRANIMQKLDAKNVADLVRIVVGNFERSEADG